ncbi:hypothetical protein [Parvicella tangerina]|uniref:Uncharacterized protein n=1 Tax=Parvicella tangerina TaxID=2829795 RepID=A0A916JMG6_9FLAO|nr:hypothetical protein [Parvicella tangerina]CAG5082003.1 hypothetical protein CRYO30217_01783 [Parvicella tangerina]
MNGLTKRSVAILIFSTFLFTYGWSQQKNRPVEGAYFFKNWWAPNFVGVPVDLDNSDYEYSAVSPTGDTIVMKNVNIRKMYTDEDILIFPDRKFHYKNAGLFEHTYTFGAEHFSWDFKYIRSFEFPLEVGIGAGVQTNTLSFPTGSGYFWANVLSLPTYIQASYKFLGNRNKVYLKGAVGLANNVSTWQIPEVSNHLFARAGLGVLFSSRNRFKHFFEIGQSYSGASGEAQSWDDNVTGNVRFSNVQFYRFTFTYGFQFGK